MGDLVCTKKGSDDKFFGRVGDTSEERVHDPGFGAEPEPSSPCPIFVLVRLRANRLIDDSVVRSTSSAKDKISLGSSEMTKFAGMSWGE